MSNVQDVFKQLCRDLEKEGVLGYNQLIMNYSDQVEQLHRKEKEQIVDKLKSKSFIYHSRAKDVSSKYEEYYRGVTDGVLAAISIIDGDRE